MISWRCLHPRESSRATFTNATQRFSESDENQTKASSDKSGMLFVDGGLMFRSICAAVAEKMRWKTSINRFQFTCEEWKVKIPRWKWNHISVDLNLCDSCCHPRSKVVRFWVVFDRLWCELIDLIKVSDRFDFWAEWICCQTQRRRSGKH